MEAAYSRRGKIEQLNSRLETLLLYYSLGGFGGGEPREAFRNREKAKIISQDEYRFLGISRGEF
jgi:hypothetical protein